MPTDRDFVTGPGIGPEALALANTTPMGGAKEVYYDSTQLRAMYEGGGLPGGPGQAGGMNTQMLQPPPSDPSTFDLGQAAMDAGAIPPEILEAMKRAQGGQTISPPLTPALSYQPAPAPLVGFEMILPLGDSVTVRISFSAEPGVRQWKRLLKHLLIEAEADDEPSEANLPRKARKHQSDES
jgi:hypothetical protein